MEKNGKILNVFSANLRYSIQPKAGIHSSLMLSSLEDKPSKDYICQLRVSEGKIASNT